MGWVYETVGRRCLVGSMNRKLILIAGFLFLAVLVVIALVLASGVRGESTPRNNWTFQFTGPASNAPAAAQTNVSSQAR